MAIPKFLEDLLIISKLGDNPSADNGLSSSGLRAKFDEAGIKIQQYINNTLLPALSELADPTNGLHMKADISMDGHRVTGLGAPVADGDAVPLEYARKIGNPHNLLDNSDFRNPVNQRGQTSYVQGYNIDRWVAPVMGEIFLTENGIKLVGVDSGYGTQNRQHIQTSESGKMYTFAVCDSEGEITIVCAVPTTTLTQKYTTWGRIGIMEKDGLLSANIRVEYGYTKTFRWAALYEGEYTVETLPEYQPKGYGVELAECQLHYRQLDKECIGSGYSVGEGNGAVMHLPFKMRVLNPTIVWTPGAVYCRANGVDYAVDSAYTDTADGCTHIVFYKNGIPGKYASAFYSTELFALSADL